MPYSTYLHYIKGAAHLCDAVPPQVLLVHCLGRATASMHPCKHYFTHTVTRYVVHFCAAASRQVLVIDCLGRAPAVLRGVTVSAKATAEELLRALAPRLRPAFSASTELLHLVTAVALDAASVSYVAREVGGWGGWGGEGVLWTCRMCGWRPLRTWRARWVVGAVGRLGR